MSVSLSNLIGPSVYTGINSLHPRRGSGGLTRLHAPCGAAAGVRVTMLFRKGRLGPGVGNGLLDNIMADQYSLRNVGILFRASCARDI